MTNRMKAIICKKYGPPNVLEMADVPKPKPKADEVLIKIMATAVNSADVRVRGLVVDGFLRRYIMRIVLGFTKPRKAILGIAFSGIVVEVGGNVSQYKVGEEIYGNTGFKFGTYAEYITLSKNACFTYKPSDATFNEAAALPFGGTTALYFLRKTPLVNTAGLKILIYGATGSVGTAAIEIAKYYEARVTSVCSEAGKKLAKRLGSNEIIDYTETNFETLPIKYDIVFDAVGKITKSQCKNILKKKGIYISVQGGDVAKATKGQLELLRQLFDTRYLHANIDKIFDFDEMIEAHEYVETGRKKANVIIRVNS